MAGLTPLGELLKSVDRLVAVGDTENDIIEMVRRYYALLQQQAREKGLSVRKYVTR